MPSTKKVVFVTTEFPALSQTFVELQIIEALKLGYDVHILTDQKNTISSSSLPALNKEYNLLERTVQFQKFRISNKLISIARTLTFTGKVPKSFFLTFNPLVYGLDGLKAILFYGLLKYRQYLNFDIYHVQFGTNIFPLANLKKYDLIKGQIITTFHGQDAHFDQSNFGKKKRSYKLLFDIVHFATYNTSYLANQIRTLGCPQNKMFHMPMCVNTDYFKPIVKQKHNVFRLISVGRLVKWKGHEFGVLASKILKELGYTFTYEIIGEGPEFDKLTTLIQSLNLEKEVQLLGRKDQAFIRGRFEKADLYIMTSTHDSSGRRETQGVVTAEAQSCGIPVCAFKSGGVPYTILENETGFLCEEGDYNSLADIIVRFIEDPQLLKEFSIRARSYIEKHYSLNKLRENIDLLYTSC